MIKPDCAKAYYKLGIIYVKLNRPQEAVEAFKQAIDINPDDDDALRGLDNANNKLISN